MTGPERLPGGERYLVAATPPPQALCWPRLLLEWLAEADAPARARPDRHRRGGQGREGVSAGDRDSQGSQTWSG